MRHFDSIKFIQRKFVVGLIAYLDLHIVASEHNAQQ